MTYGQNPSPVQPMPLGYAVPGVQPLLPVRPRAKTVTVLLYIMLVAYALLAVATVLLYLVMPDIEATGPVQNPGFLIAIGLGLLGLGLGVFVVAILTIIFYCMWQHRVHSNARVLAGRSLQFTPGWGVGYWFIPIINLFRPYQVTKEIDQATPPGQDALSSTIGLWWSAFILSLIASAVGGVLEGPEDSMTAGSVGFEVLSNLFNIAWTYLSIRIVASITERQAAVIGA